MTFKMKGSAFKLNNIATKSALKQASSPMKVIGEWTSKINEVTGEEEFTQVPRGARPESGGSITSTGSDIVVPSGQRYEGSIYDLKEELEPAQRKFINRTIQAGGGPKMTPEQANSWDRQIQDKIDAGDPLNEKEKEIQAYMTEGMKIESASWVEGEDGPEKPKDWYRRGKMTTE